MTSRMMMLEVHYTDIVRLLLGNTCHLKGGVTKSMMPSSHFSRCDFFFIFCPKSPYFAKMYSDVFECISISQLYVFTVFWLDFEFCNVIFYEFQSNPDWSKHPLMATTAFTPSGLLRVILKFREEYTMMEKAQQQRSTLPSAVAIQWKLFPPLSSL